MVVAVSLGSLGCALGVVGFIKVAGFMGVCPGVRWVHPLSLGSLGSAVAVVGGD